MQLPEGREKSTICHTKYSLILDNIRDLGFTGKCCADISGKKFVMVFKYGTCILAEYPPYKSKTAYEKTLDIINKSGDFTLFEYLPEEIILAEDYNSEYSIDFGSSETEGKYQTNPFEKVLTDMKEDDIINIKNDIHNEIENFLIESNMNHLIKETGESRRIS